MRRLVRHRVRSKPDTTRITPGHNITEASQVKPDELRARIQDALARLPEDRRAAFRDTVLQLIESFGVDTGSRLLILGIPAVTADDLTPLDIAKLIHYLRLNVPSLTQALAAPLSELLSGAAGDAGMEKAPRKAA
jgi:hypothetical protein